MQGQEPDLSLARRPAKEMRPTELAQPLAGEGRLTRADLDLRAPMAKAFRTFLTSAHSERGPPGPLLFKAEVARLGLIWDAARQNQAIRRKLQ